MTAPSDFLDLDRLNDDGNPHHQIEEQWDEPGGGRVVKWDAEQTKHLMERLASVKKAEPESP